MQIRQYFNVSNVLAHPNVSYLGRRRAEAEVRDSCTYIDIFLDCAYTLTNYFFYSNFCQENIFWTTITPKLCWNNFSIILPIFSNWLFSSKKFSITEQGGPIFEAPFLEWLFSFRLQWDGNWKNSAKIKVLWIFSSLKKGKNVDFSLWVKQYNFPKALII